MEPFKFPPSVIQPISDEWVKKWIDFMLVVSRHATKYDAEYKALCTISESEYVTMEFIENHPEYEWNWCHVSYNPNFTIDFVEKHHNHQWNYSALSKHPSLTIDFVLKHIHKEWDWGYIVKHKFSMDHNRFIEQKTQSLRTWVLIAILYEYYCNTIPISRIEQILCDDYLVKQLAKY